MSRGNARADTRGRSWTAWGTAVATLLGAGCALDRHSERTPSGMAPRATVRDPSSPTLGTDFFSVPRGQTIPASGLGVDLVRDSASRVDPGLIMTELPGTSR